MVSKKSRKEVRVKKHTRLRNRFAGTAERPRLAVFRSNNHMYAQIIDDSVGNTLAAASTLEKAAKEELKHTVLPQATPAALPNNLQTAVPSAPRYRRDSAPTCSPPHKSLHRAW